MKVLLINWHQQQSLRGQWGPKKILDRSALKISLSHLKNRCTALVDQYNNELVSLFLLILIWHYAAALTVGTSTEPVKTATLSDITAKQTISDS